MATIDTIKDAVEDFRESISDSMDDFINNTKQRIAEFASDVDDNRDTHIKHVLFFSNAREVTIWQWY